MPAMLLREGGNASRPWGAPTHDSVGAGHARDALAARWKRIAPTGRSYVNRDPVSGSNTCSTAPSTVTRNAWPGSGRRCGGMRATSATPA